MVNYDDGGEISPRGEFSLLSCSRFYSFTTRSAVNSSEAETEGSK